MEEQMEQKIQDLPDDALPEENADRSEGIAEESVKEKKPSRIALWLEKTKSTPLPLVLAFFLPFLIFSVCLAVQGVYPFGDGQIINYDGWHQYYPFLLELWDHFHEGESLLFDWSMGMGTNFLSMLSYYGSSPLNLLLLLVPVRDFRLLFTLFVAIRIGLAGLFTAMFLRKVTPNPGWSVAFFGLGYALCGYMMGYYWNNMWLDTVALYPLLCLATVTLFREGKSRLYVLVLAMSLFSNYYIGYMSCVFTVLVFFSLCILDRVRFSDFLRKGFRLLFATVLGAGITTVLLLPAFFGLFSTSNTQDAVPVYVSFYESVRDLIAPLASFHIPAVMDGLPNITTCAILVLMAFSFLWAKRIGFREKIVAFFMIVFLMFSMNFSVLNYIWHGMHFTNMLPYRFAFLFSFVIVVMAYVYYKKALSDFDLIDATGMFLFSILVIFCAYGYYEQWSILATVAVFAFFVVFCALHAGKMISKKIFSVFICFVILLEMGVSAWLGTNAVGTTSYSGYSWIRSAPGEEIQSLVDLAKEREEGSEDFYRLETVNWWNLNASCMYGYNGISQFASSANRDVSAFLQGLGMPADPGSNRFVYVHGTPLSNTVLGIKYLLHDAGYLSDPELKCLSAASEEQTAALYENTGFAGLGFMTEKGAEAFEFDMSKDAYVRLNELFSALTGLEGDLFYPLLGTLGDLDHLNAALQANGSYDLTSREMEYAVNVSRVFRLEYEIPKSGTVYVYANAPAANAVYANNEYHEMDSYPYLFSAGYHTEGTGLQVRTTFPDDANGDFYANASITVLMMDQELWEEGLARLQDEKMEIESFEETHVKANITARQDGYLYTSIPLDHPQNWTLFVDGKETEIQPFAGTFVGVSLSAGEHQLELKYSPRGFVPGVWITLVSLVLFVLLCFFERSGGKLFPEKPQPVPMETPLEKEECLAGEKDEIEEKKEFTGEEDDHPEADVYHP